VAKCLKKKALEEQQQEERYQIDLGYKKKVLNKLK